MPSHWDFSRRERQIMDVIFAPKEATVLQITEELPDPPTTRAVRRMLDILVEKGHRQGHAHGREVIYSARASKKKDGANAFRKVLEPLFNNSLEEALAVHLVSPTTSLSREQCARWIKLIAKSRKDPRGRHRARTPCGCFKGAPQVS